MRLAHLLPLCIVACYPHKSRLDDRSVDTGTSNPDGDDTAPTDTAPPQGGSVPVVHVDYALDVVKEGTMPDLAEPGKAVMSSTNNFTYIMDRPAEDSGLIPMVHFILDSYIYPQGDYCIGTEDEYGGCHGTVWTSGRLYNQHSPQPSTDFCIDVPNGRMFLVKDRGLTIEIGDVAFEGEEAYTYNTPYNKIDLADDVIANNAKWMGPCEYLPATDEIVLSSRGRAEGVGMQIIGASEDGSLHRHTDLDVNPVHIYAINNGENFLLDDQGAPIIYLMDAATFAPAAMLYAAHDIVHFGVNRVTNKVYLAHGTSGAGMLDANDPEAPEVAIDIPGSVEWAFADSAHDMAWFVSNDKGTWSVYQVQDGIVVNTAVVPGNVVSVADPSDMGDLVVFQKGTAADSATFTVYGARPLNNDARPPLKIFIFTTIEEPSDSAMEEGCTSGNPNFATEISLVQANASRLASLGVPVAMAITDNFAEKSNSDNCDVASEIYPYLQGLGFELGAMLHNRPCYHCSSGDTQPNDLGQYSNPDFCGNTDPNYIAAGNTGACFPDDPEYCGLGDWECYYAFLAPRAELADANIPGGASFIVGGDRHGMWEYDWIRFYQEVVRQHTGKVGFDLTLFAGTWANNSIGYDDPRGKNPTPWRPQDRVAAWKPGDIDNWRGDSAYSKLLYLPGINSATVKISEQQHSGMYMEDFFDAISDGLFTSTYNTEDFDVQWTNLREAVNYRQYNRVNTWYFHIHDNGIVNIADASGVDVMLTGRDGKPRPVIEELRDLITRINETYVAAGVVEWAYPSEIKADYVDW